MFGFAEGRFILANPRAPPTAFPNTTHNMLDYSAGIHFQADRGKTTSWGKRGRAYGYAQGRIASNSPVDSVHFPAGSGSIKNDISVVVRGGERRPSKMNGQSSRKSLATKANAAVPSDTRAEGFQAWLDGAERATWEFTAEEVSCNESLSNGVLFVFALLLQFAIFS